MRRLITKLITIATGPKATALSLDALLLDATQGAIGVTKA